MKKIALILCLFFSASFARAQQNTFSRIEMKNGTQWVGELLAQDDSSYHLQISGGSILVLPKKQVTLITIGSKSKVLDTKNRTPVIIDQSGAYVKLKFCLMPGTGFRSNLSTSTLSTISLQFAYKINRFVQPGIALGVLFPSSGNSPLYGVEGRFEGEPLKRSTAPYYYGSAGYYFSGNVRADDRFREEGGINLGAGIGLKFYTERERRWILELGYAHQRVKEFYDYRPWGNIETRYYRLHRMVLAIGLEF